MKLFITLSTTIAIVSYNSSAEKYSLPEKPAPYGTPYSGFGPQGSPYGGAAPQLQPFSGPGPQLQPFGGPGPQLQPFGGPDPQLQPFGGPGPQLQRFGGPGPHLQPFGGPGLQLQPPRPQSPPYGGPRPQIPYPIPIYKPGYQRNHRYSSSSSEGRHGCRWNDYSSDESGPKRSKKCSRCYPLQRSNVGFTALVSVRYNTLSNGCIQAILSCQQSETLAISSVQTNSFRNTTLAYGVGVQVVAQCGKDGKWHSKAITENYVTVRGVACTHLTKQQRDELLHPAQETSTDSHPNESDENDYYHDGSGDLLSEVVANPV